MGVMGMLAFQQYRFTLSKIDLFIATLLIIFHTVPPVHVMLFLQSFHSLGEAFYL